MIAAEMKNTGSIVRIHDEFCKDVSQECILELNRIVSNAYKRRMLLAGEKGKRIHREMPKSL